MSFGWKTQLGEGSACARPSRITETTGGPGPLPQAQTTQRRATGEAVARECDGIGGSGRQRLCQTVGQAHLRLEASQYLVAVRTEQRPAAASQRRTRSPSAGRRARTDQRVETGSTLAANPIESDLSSRGGLRVSGFQRFAPPVPCLVVSALIRVGDAQVVGGGAVPRKRLK